ncbi:hypothetical protein SCUCBS95973_004603 [Sporothrix curviconia]|uniref:GPI anchored protein n=1 Tax=Sporothrix curviconia TaxID=1260050 RepID=A0ABP0BQ13_9PEZI
MLIQRALLGLPTSFLLLALTYAKDVHSPPPPEDQPRQIIPLAIRKMGLDVGEKFYPEQYYGFESQDEERSDSAVAARYGSKTDSFGRSLASLFSFGRRSPSTATSPNSVHEHQERQDGGRWPVAARRTFPRDEDGPLSVNASEAASIARLFPPAYLPPFSIHHEGSDNNDDDDDEDDDDSTDNASRELFRRAADALVRLQRRQWGCPTGTTSCEDIGYPYSCCSNTEKCYKVTDTGLGPVGCCPDGETCGGAVSDCTSDSTACPESLGGGCCIAGYVCEGVGCVKSSASGTATATVAKTSTTTSTTVTTTGQPTTVVVTVVVTETSGGTLTTRTTTITSTSTSATETTSTTGTSTSSGGGVAPVKPTLTTTASGLPAGYCPTGYYACLASAGGGCCQTGRDCQTTSCPPAAAMTTIVNTNGITVVVPATAAAAATAASATCASGWFLCGSNAGPLRHGQLLADGCIRHDGAEGATDDQQW